MADIYVQAMQTCHAYFNLNYAGGNLANLTNMLQQFRLVYLMITPRQRF